MGSCISRFSQVMAALMAVVANVAMAEGPRYSFLGASYEWTDVKFGVEPSSDPAFNDGDFEGFNVEGSLGITSFLHVAGQYFDGDCVDCAPPFAGETGETKFDLDYTGYKIGLGVNQSLERVGLDANTDVIIRFNYLDVELGSIEDDGWSVEGHLRAQISQRAEIHVGYERHEVGDVTNGDVILGLAYEVAAGFALNVDAIVFDDDTGVAIGARWYFGELVFGDRDSVVR